MLIAPFTAIVRQIHKLVIYTNHAPLESNHAATAASVKRNKGWKQWPKISTPHNAPWHSWTTFAQFYFLLSFFNFSLFPSTISHRTSEKKQWHLTSSELHEIVSSFNLIGFNSRMLFFSTSQRKHKCKNTEITNVTNWQLKRTRR